MSRDSPRSSTPSAVILVAERGVVANHPERAAIEAALAAGHADRAIAARFGITKDSVRRHRIGMGSKLDRLIAAGKAEGAESARDRVELLYTKALRLLERVEKDEASKPAAMATVIRECRGLVELLAKITGELDERAQVQIVNLSASPEWEAVRRGLIAALAPYPDAQRAVTLSLREIEQ